MNRQNGAKPGLGLACVCTPMLESRQRHPLQLYSVPQTYLQARIVSAGVLRLRVSQQMKEVATANANAKTMLV